MDFQIREEKKEDFNQIYDLNTLAFGQENESIMIGKIREGINYIPGLSLVAEVGGKIVGHILFSKVQIQGMEVFETLCLAPMAVHPEYQNQGIGLNLIFAGLEKATMLGFGSVVVLGHPNYYPKAGFRKASDWAIQCPYEVPQEAFMAIELVEGSLDGKSGMVLFPDEFSDV